MTRPDSSPDHETRIGGSPNDARTVRHGDRLPSVAASRAAGGQPRAHEPLPEQLAPHAPSSRTSGAPSPGRSTNGGPAGTPRAAPGPGEPHARPRTSTRGNTLVIAPQGAFDGAGLDGIDDLIRAEHDGNVVIDLSDCMLTGRSALATLDPTRWDRAAEDVCVVCSRATGRQLLAQAGVSQRMAVFGRTEDALQARILAHSGYGPGWTADDGHAARRNRAR